MRCFSDADPLQEPVGARPDLCRRVLRRYRHRFKSFRQPPGPDRAVEHLTEVLELTPEQQEQVREVFIRLHPEFLKESERAKAFRRAFIIKHFNEMTPLLDERQKAVAQEFLEKQLSRKMPPPPKEGKAN